MIVCADQDRALGEREPSECRWHLKPRWDEINQKHAEIARAASTEGAPSIKRAGGRGGTNAGY